MDEFGGAFQWELDMIRKAGVKHIPLSGSFELLPLCNMNCDMCYVRLSRAEMERQGRLRTADEWLALGRELKEAGTLFLLLTGGEPLLYPEFRRLYLGLRELGFILTINTNGTLLDEGWADFFAQHPPRRINITLYGADAGAYERLCHYTEGFDRTVRAIRLLKERGLEVKVSCSVTKANQGDVERFVDIVHSLGAAVAMDTYMCPATRERERPFNEQARMTPQEAAQARVRYHRARMTPEKFTEYADSMVWAATHAAPGADEPKRMSCQAGRSSFTINWQGELHPCVLLSAPSYPVFETGFAAAWQQLGEELGKVAMSSRCSRCGLRYNCETCAACALLETGSYEGVPEYMCQYTAETVRLLAEELVRQGIIRIEKRETDEG